MRVGIQGVSVRECWRDRDGCYGGGGVVGDLGEIGDEWCVIVVVVDGRAGGGEAGERVAVAAGGGEGLVEVLRGGESLGGVEGRELGESRLPLLLLWVSILEGVSLGGGWIADGAVSNGRVDASIGHVCIPGCCNCWFLDVL